MNARVIFLNCKERMTRFGNSNPLKGMYFQKYFYLKSILSLLEGQTINKSILSLLEGKTINGDMKYFYLK